LYCVGGPWPANIWCSV